MNALAEKPPVTAEEPSRLGPIAATPDRRDQEFLPAALAILETPPSPVRLALIGIIATLVVVALAWSWFGRIDIVAVGQGKVQPTGRVRVVPPLETGKVSGLLVRNGARVAAGDVLVELAKDETAAEETALQVELSAALGEIARRRTTLAAVREGRRGETCRRSPSMAPSPNPSACGRAPSSPATSRRSMRASRALRRSAASAWPTASASPARSLPRARWSRRCGSASTCAPVSSSATPAPAPA